MNLLPNERFTQLKLDILVYRGAFDEVLQLLQIEALNLGSLSVCKRYMQLITSTIKSNEQSNLLNKLELEYLIRLISLITGGTSGEHENIYLKCLKEQNKQTKNGTVGQQEEEKFNVNDIANNPVDISYCDLNAFLEQQTAGASLLQGSSSSSNLIRQLIILPLTLDNLISFTVDACICVLKKTVLLSVMQPYDLGLGHLVVLCQYHWPYYYEVFQRTVTTILCRGTVAGGAVMGTATAGGGNKFVYPLFCKYVHVPDIIEEFMSLVDEEKAAMIRFDLNPISTSSGISPVGTSVITTSAIAAMATTDNTDQPLNLHSTRGMTRTYKEEMKTLLQRQMAMTTKTTINGDDSEMSTQTIIEFLHHEIGPYLIHHLNI